MMTKYTKPCGVKSKWFHDIGGNCVFHIAASRSRRFRLRTPKYHQQVAENVRNYLSHEVVCTPDIHPMRYPHQQWIWLEQQGCPAKLAIFAFSFLNFAGV